MEIENVDNAETLSAKTFEIKNGKLITTPELLEVFIKKIVMASFEGTEDWYEKEVIVVDKTTKMEITNCEGAIKNFDNNPKSPFRDYIYPRLAELGITYQDDKK